MTPYLLEKDKAKCCCCGMCEKNCPTKAIQMIPDKNGLLYPVLNSNECVKCGKCSKVCQYSNGDIKASFDEEHIKVFAGKLIDKERLSSSSSGGAFWALAFSIISQNGVVYGAAWDANHQVSQCRIDNNDELSKLQGSKYVFCDTGNTYYQVKRDLLKGLKVLYSGTPCHINGLYSYLGRDYDNLYTCDLICHGVPAPMFLSAYIQELEKKYKSRVTDIKFKEKSESWRNPNLVVLFENKQMYKEHIWSTAYGKLYHSRLTVMRACDFCQYATLPRKSDITIGDFWGYNENIHHMGSDTMGISSILVNSKKGITLVEFANRFIMLKEIGLNDAMQLHLQKSAKPASEEKIRKFEKLFKKRGIIETAQLINKTTYCERFEKIISRIKQSLCCKINQMCRTMNNWK